MTSKDKRPDHIAETHRRAEARARQEAASLETLEALSPEAARTMMHELRVHQIQLEMQNEELRQAQAELNAERARYFELYDLAPVGYCTVSEPGMILQANFTAAALLGRSRGALATQPFARFILREDEDRFYLLRKKAIESGESQACELRMVKNDGTSFWALLAAAPAPASSADGTPAMRITLSDVSARKQSEMALETRNLLLNALINSKAGLVIFALDRDYRYTAFNEQHRVEMRSVWHADIKVGARLLDYMTDPGLRESAKQSIDRALGGESFTEVRHQPGVDIYYEFLWGPIQRGDGAIDGMTAFVRDITARRQLEIALQKSEGQFRSFVENANDVLFELDPSGVFRYVSPQWTVAFGYARDEVIGQPFAGFVHADDVAGCFAFLQKVFATGTQQSGVEYRVRCKNGAYRWYAANASMVRDPATGTPALVGIGRDITERKLADAKIQRLSRLYATLSQCNQAIVRCTSELELFPHICRDTVTFGGMKMAWIGFVDAVSGQVKPVAQYGDASNYLADVNITVNANETQGRGPTGTALREDRPYWCQDFANDAATAPWHEQGARAGWAASASLPLHRFGVVVGAFTLYSAEVNAFDEDIRRLLVEMAADIDFALDSYAREAGRKTAEVALRDSETRNRALVSAIPDLIFTNRRDGEYLDAHASDPAMLLVPAESFLHRRVGEVLPPAIADQFMKAFTDALDSGVIQVLDYSLRLGGQDRHYEARVVPSGEDKAISIVRDVTARKQVEGALLASERRFRTIVETEPECVKVMGSNGELLEMNAAGLAMLEVDTLDEAKAHWFAGFIVPDHHAAFRALHQGALDGESGRLEFAITGLRGTRRWLETNAAPMRDADGHITMVLGITRDITERKRAAAEVRKLTRAIEQSPASIVITDRAGKIEYVNPHFERITGYASAEVIGQNPRLLKSGATPMEVYKQLWAAVSVGGEWRGELCNRRKNGELFWEYAAISGVRDDQGKIVHFIAVKADITERKQSEASRLALEVQLRESQKMQAIGTLAGGIAHDFNNILATILGNVDLARDDVSANPRALESLAEIRKAGARARGLVQQILSFSRRDPASRKRIALGPVIEESARLLRATLPARLQLEVQCDAGVPVVLADANQIEQIVINLATNALQAMPGRPGHIGIRLDAVPLDAALAASHPELQAMLATHPGLCVRLTVRDDGPGMDAATMARIFEPFFTTKPVGEGTGLGLSVVHGIARTHDGAIVVTSQPGMGATFALYLPAADGEDTAPSPAPVQDAAAAFARNGDGRHILYLDDDESLVFLVTRLLERRGYRISAFTDQREAIDALRADPAAFDLVVTDYNMPGMSGLDVARTVRALRADLPVAIASGFIDETLHTEADAAGVRELIFKASAVEELCEAFARLAQAVGKRSAP